MAIIHHVKDENGQEPVFELIRDIALKGMEDEGYANLVKYIAQALDYLEEVGVPEIKALEFEQLIRESENIVRAYSQKPK